LMLSKSLSLFTLPLWHTHPDKARAVALGGAAKHREGRKIVTPPHRTYPRTVF
jgi:hypothetical protein